MSHQPPVPQGNVSPYPIAEPAHAPADPASTIPPRWTKASSRRPGKLSTWLPLGAALAAAGGGALYWFGRRR